jgi:hypothetical protein
LPWQSATGAAPGSFIHSLQGCGKNIFSDQIAKITAPYSNGNIDDINEICGAWNGILENIVLGVCNELKSDKKSKTVDQSKLKSAQSEPTLRVKQKYKDNRTVENVSNLMFISNNFSPFKQEIGDRRNLDLQCLMPPNPDTYFKALSDEIKNPLFHQTLFTYLMNYDVSIDYDFVHELPMTDLKQAIQETYKNPFERFITRHYQQFINGWNTTDCQRIAQIEIIDRLPDNEKKDYKKNGISIGLLKYCGKAQRQRIRGTDNREYVYKLSSNYVDKFKPSEEQIASGEYLEYLENPEDIV